LLMMVVWVVLVSRVIVMVVAIIVFFIPSILSQLAPSYSRVKRDLTSRYKFIDLTYCNYQGQIDVIMRV